MALDRIASSGLRAQLRAVDNAAHNIAQLNVAAPELLRTRFESNVAPPRGGGGVRAETELRASSTPRTTSPVLDPQINESLVRDEVDIVQEITNTFVARRAFQANLTVERASRSFVQAALNLGA
ncbi:MAG: hypothetical protein ACR2NO_06135 [Chloroflexota bacterium]